MNFKWDAETYTNQFSFVPRYGTDLIDLIDTKSSKSVLDLGCGNGVLTKQLSERGFKAFGLDASPELLQIARRNYPELVFLLGDAVNFKLPEKVDAVFSNAVFHWIPEEKQPDLLRCVYDCLNGQGQFVFEFGGFGNNALIHRALKEEFYRRGYSYTMPFYFPTLGTYASLLEKIGFEVTYAVLFDRMTELAGEEGLADWIRMFIQAPWENIPESEKNDIIRETVGKLRSALLIHGKWYADYVRLRMKAKKKSRLN